MKVIKAIYNFLVGDMVILLGVICTLLILALFKIVPALSGIQPASGALLFVAVVILLVLTLRRETGGKP